MGASVGCAVVGWVGAWVGGGVRVSAGRLRVEYAGGRYLSGPARTIGEAFNKNTIHNIYIYIFIKSVRNIFKTLSNSILYIYI